ncbi:DUF4197 domain-containing protein [Desulfosarcina sp. OttesenSCG-928-A07]|nr:DUF4197 domain-containing protein [Desulfosarcina sp. OttesenSCG-928-G17]MDL2329704.1 DUF4197 domain-containing protein [Desulfosarcina sp. OttesenSCG-928-A07]
MMQRTPRSGRRSILFCVAAATILLTVGACKLGTWAEQNADLLKIDTHASTPLSLQDISDGLKAALQVGADRVISQVGRTNGFNADRAIHIPLPEQLEAAKKILSAVGMGNSMAVLEQKLNTAAEMAAPKAKALFMEAIRDMTFEDVKSIYNGANDSATQYFKKKMTPALVREMTPMVSGSLSDVGAIQVYDQIMARYQAIPLVPDIKANLSAYVVQKGMDGIFYYLAKEEAAIRENPARQTTELLKRVFGQK